MTGAVKVQFTGTGVRDAYGNIPLASSELAWKRDVTGPSMLPPSRPVSARLNQQVSVAVRFSETLAGAPLNAGMFDLVRSTDNSVVANTNFSISGSGTSYTVKFTPMERGTFRLRLKAPINNPPTDLLGNALLANGAFISVNVT